MHVHMNMKGALPFFAMVVSQIAQVGVTIASMKAIETGMHNFSFIFYANALASLILLPAVFFTHRSQNRPALNLSVTGGFLVLGLVGFLARVVGYAGNTYASPTVVTAIYNLVPGFTFLLATIFGLERLGHEGLTKIIGALVSIVGALIVTLYAGPAIITSRLSSIFTPRLLLQSSSNEILGGLLVLFNSAITAFCIILQALILKKYPMVLILVFVNCSITAFLSLLALLILEQDLNELSLWPKTRLFVILYTGFFGSGFQLGIEGWCIKIYGPLFVAMFQPLGIIIAAIMGFIFLGNGLYLGSLIGSAVIVIGFYGVMWGKAKEDKNVKVESSKSPLLKENTEENNVVLV